MYYNTMMSFEGDNNTDLDFDTMADGEQTLPEEIRQKKSKGALRIGYTTGASATAATKAALYALINGKPTEEVTVTLPKGKAALIRIAWTRTENDNSITCAVIKDGGDDPDVTHGAEICSTVRLSDKPGQIRIEGGEGVGRVTKPGLGLEIGKAAINPTPMRMLKQVVSEMSSRQLENHGVDVKISVPKGDEIAKKTDNPRLGILGGISILGTTGFVLPYSTSSFAASIRQGVNVAIANGADTVVLTTGGRSEDFARGIFRVPDHSFIQMGDFAGYSIRQCANKSPLRKVIIAGFIGKLTKMAMGIKQTHVAGSHVDMEFMARLAAECKAPQKVVEEVKSANTARHVSEIINSNKIVGYYDHLCEKVYEQMSQYTQGRLQIEVLMFEFDGTIIGRYLRK